MEVIVESDLCPYTAVDQAQHDFPDNLDEVSPSIFNIPLWQENDHLSCAFDGKGIISEINLD